MVTKLIPLDSPKVGDLVFSVINGNGMISAVKHPDEVYQYVIEAAFTNGKRESFTIEGKLYDDNSYPTIYQGNHEHGTFKLDL